jgi:hypothetical protein
MGWFPPTQKGILPNTAHLFNTCKHIFEVDMTYGCAAVPCQMEGGIQVLVRQANQEDPY